MELSISDFASRCISFFVSSLDAYRQHFSIFVYQIITDRKRFLVDFNMKPDEKYLNLRLFQKSFDRGWLHCFLCLFFLSGLLIQPN